MKQFTLENLYEFAKKFAKVEHIFKKLEDIRKKIREKILRRT